MKKKFFLLSLLLVFTLTAGLGCKAVPQDVERASQPVKLTFWRVFDDADTMQPIIQAYQAIHPNVTIEYRKLRYEEYEQALLDALAEDRGPDMFSVHNTWVKEYQNKIEPLPVSYRLPFQYVTGTIKKETKVELRDVQALSLRQFRQNFLDTVYDDAVLSSDGEGAAPAIYGLPFSVDTLALFYNRSLLNGAGIPEPPTTWEEFQDHVKILTKFDADNKIIQSGAAIGTANNVERSFDLVSLLMMQNGAKMTNDSGTATFAQIPPELSGVRVPPAEGALGFYLDFANPTKEVYTWNSDMPGSLEAFTQGKTAYFFGYSYHIPLIRAAAPKLNFDIALVPQIDRLAQMNYANYFLETVSKKSKNAAWAWDFLQFASSAEQVTQYLKKAEKPTALKSLVNVQLEDLDLGVFAAGLLTAKSWYRGNDAAAAEKIFGDMVRSALSGEVPIKEAIGLAQNKINQTLR